MASKAVEIREAIEETRTQLGQTVQGHAQKADVKSQLARKVEEARGKTLAQVHGVAHTATTVPARVVSHKRTAVPLAGAAMSLLLVLLRRHNSNGTGQ